jgi:hypothetical protein
MSLPTLATTSIPPTVSQTVPIVILGTDATLAALPATPVQLAHACLRAGFANVVPASWGDELVASAVLRRLSEFGSGPAIQCSCPIVAHRLLSVGGDLRPVMLPTLPPPVAVARYIRALSHPARARITYVGTCPGAIDESIDIRMTPESLMEMLAERDIVLSDQPRVFESLLAPDRRRFRSQPGGVPSVEALWGTGLSPRTLVEVEADDLVADVAQHVLNGKNILIDVSPRLGCACSGAVDGMPVREARTRVVMHEPPRAAAPVIDERTAIPLDLELPAASRSPVDVMAARPSVPTRRPVAPLRSADAPHAHRASPAHGIPAVPDLRSARVAGGLVPPRTPTLPRSPTPPRSLPAIGSTPVVRKTEGKTLARAFIVRRRLPQKGAPLPAPTSPEQRPGETSNPERKTDEPTAPSEATPPSETNTPHLPTPPFTLRQTILMLLAAIGIAVTAGVRFS